MAIFQQGETYQHVRKFREDSSPTDVSSATMVITYPCESTTTSVDMSKVETGKYQAMWDIPDDATYGEYVVEVTALTGTTTSKFVSSFYILPWNITQQIRSTSGIKQSNDVSDDDLAQIAWNAYLETKEEVFQLVINEKIKEDCNHYIDGSNKDFYARNRHIVSDHTICDEDIIYGYYKDEDYEWQDLTISVTDAEKGKLSIADENGDALEGSTSCDIIYSYRIKSRTFKEQMFKKAVVYLASHEVVLRFNELDKATLGDLNSNKPIILANPDRMYKKYKKTLNRIKKLKVGGV